MFPALFAMLLPVLAQAAPDPAPACCVYPSLPAEARAPAAFAPPGWEIETQARGKLGTEGRPAVAVVLRKALGPTADRQGEGDDQRILALLLEVPAHRYRLAVENHTLIPSLPPAQRRAIGVALGDGRRIPGLEIRRGALRVRLNVAFGSGPTAQRDLTYDFRYRGGRLYLIDYEEFLVGSDLGTRNRSYDFLTGKALVSVGIDCAGRADIVPHCHTKDTRARLQTARPPTIEDVGDGLEFTPPSAAPSR